MCQRELTSLFLRRYSTGTCTCRNLLINRNSPVGPTRKLLLDPPTEMKTMMTHGHYAKYYCTRDITNSVTTDRDPECDIAKTLRINYIKTCTVEPTERMKLIHTYLMYVLIL